MCNDKVMKHINEKRTGQLREVSGNVVYTDSLTSFLYELMRDHLPAGTVEQLVMSAVVDKEVIFTNGWLAKYANNLAEELVNAKRNNLSDVLSQAFGGKAEAEIKEERPSFKTDEQLLEERTKENKKIIDTLVQTGQIKAEEAEQMKKDLEELHKEEAPTTVHVGGGEPAKEGDVVVSTNSNSDLKFEKVE